MKFSVGGIVLILLALALVVAMVMTLKFGGNYSRHGYGRQVSPADAIERVFSEKNNNSSVLLGLYWYC